MRQGRKSTAEGIFYRAIHQRNEGNAIKKKEDTHKMVEIALRGTPTVLVNGWQFHDTPSLRELELALEALTAGERPRALSRR